MTNMILTSFINNSVYYAICVVLSLLVLLGIFLMSKVEKSVIGNLISAVAIAIGIIVTMIYKEILPVFIIYPSMIVGTLIGLFLAYKVGMMQMPQLVALLNGVGGAASAIIGAFSLFGIGSPLDVFSQITSVLALEVGVVTFIGSLVAALKLHKILPQKPIVLPKHELFTTLTLVLSLAVIVTAGFKALPIGLVFALGLILSLAFGLIFTIKVGGADMPITISLLNSFSGVAGAIAGLAINDILLVSIGAIVGASGLLLTQVMCKAMNRHLFDILLGKTTTTGKSIKVVEDIKEEPTKEVLKDNPVELLQKAKNVIIVPGYGMAIAQAQHLVKKLADYLVQNGAKVSYAVHPVAGRMPGHMNVLLCEANVDYDDLYEMDDINPKFKDADVTIVVGANDVLNPAARNAVGTPIYQMPILNVDQCKHVLVFNYDLKPGYAGVDNPLYKKTEGVSLFLGNASDTLQKLLEELTK